MKSKFFCFLLSAFCFQFTALAQGTAFTYQGRLAENGSPFSGSAEFQATLWDAAEGGGAQGANIPALVIVPVTNGLFTLPLNFGSAPFASGAERWLQLEIRTSIGAFSLLSPRQRLSATPYSIMAGNVTGPVPASQLAGTLPGVNLGGTYPGAVIFNNAANDFSGNGASLINVNAATLNGIPSAGFWSTTGNAGANPTNGAFLGTRDNLPLELMVYSSRVLRLEPHPLSPNVIGGERNNRVGKGVFGASIVGGGSSDYPNRVNAEYGAVLGGFGNTAAGRASAVMGFNNAAQGDFSAAAGAGATASGNSSLAMGNATTASGWYSAALGNGTIASGESSAALGYDTRASALGATAVGVATEASGERSLAAGFLTVASGFCATAFGRSSIAAGEYSFAAGYGARANHQGSFVWADSSGGTFTSTAWDQFLIKAGGGVGIGTPNPQGSLHLYSANNPTVVRLQSPPAARLRRGSNSSAIRRAAPANGVPATSSPPTTADSSAGLAFVVNGAGFDNRFGEVETMRIVNGRVGIGTIAPVQRAASGGQRSPPRRSTRTCPTATSRRTSPR